MKKELFTYTPPQRHRTEYIVSALVPLIRLVNVVHVILSHPHSRVDHIVLEHQTYQISSFATFTAFRSTWFLTKIALTQ